MGRFPTQRARLSVRNPGGDVRVETADVAETTVELVPLDDSDATRAAIDKAHVEARGDEVVVEIESRRGWSIAIGEWSLGRSPKVGVRITCPYGSDLDVKTAAADVTASGRVGDTAVQTASGSVELVHVGGSLTLRTASGDVTVERVDGRATVQGVSGDIELGSVGGDLTVNAVSGDVTVGDAGGDLSVTTVSGDQAVRAAGPGDVRLKAVSGDVEVLLRQGLRIRLDVNSVSGTISSELEVGDAPAAAERPEADLRVRTVSGDVRIGRAQSSESASAKIALA
ncbi:MAG TPA: DUF4097 family beta strand repeat-containing protein [Gaiellaceae bacterium]|nr:DUF4097 family beta strand repeat-containing protein [Gaiellaceae bacterium]